MQIIMLAVLLGALSMVQIAGGISDPYVPDCGQKCWVNSKFVSTCLNDTKCLCEDEDFQSAVYQCLYSQCQTTQFGLALHYAIAECSMSGLDNDTVSPPLIRQHLRKRQSPQAEYGPEHGSVAPRHSIYRRAGSGSGSAYPHPTRTAAKDKVYTAYDGKPQPTATKSPSANVVAERTESPYDSPKTI